MEKYFLHQIKHNKATDTWDKGIVIKDTLEQAEQGFHAYLGAYAYGYNQDTDYVQVLITDIMMNRIDGKKWEAKATPEPEGVE
jgi:hypothetical protein